MEYDFSKLMRALRIFGTISITVSGTGIVVRSDIHANGFDVFIVTMLCLACVGVSCLMFAHRIRQILRIHTGKEPEIY